MKLAWLTDIHLNFLKLRARERFYEDIVIADSDAVLVTGDIAEAPVVVDIMKEVAEYVQKPVYFILGNHDYYRGQVGKVREEMTVLTKSEKFLFWLPAAGPQSLTKDTALVGQDGWADGRYGHYLESKITLNDSHMIVDLFRQNIIGKYAMLKKMQELADHDARKLYLDVEHAIEIRQPKKIIVLTHIPPFREVAFHAGEPCNDDFMPYFCSKAMGDVLRAVAKANTNIDFLVLCGHTHERKEYQPLDNLIVKVGQAKYGHPKIEKIINI
jgi:predicted MPP superfamily phosphohydrolase